MTNTVISGYSTMQVLFCLLSVAALFYRESIIQFNSNSFFFFFPLFFFFFFFFVHLEWHFPYALFVCVIHAHTYISCTRLYYVSSIVSLTFHSVLIHWRCYDHDTRLFFSGTFLPAVLSLYSYQITSGI